MTIKHFITCGWTLAVCVPVLGQPKPTGPERWEPDIRKLEALDKSETHPDDAILFVGSSSVRLWDTIAEEMAPYPVIQRGYGGARFSDLNVYAKRLIHPHQFRALVMFVGNDVTGSPNDKTPAEVVSLVRSIVTTTREKHPNAPIFVLETTPTASRWKAWPKIQAVNLAIAELCSDLPNVHWISTSPHFLNEQQQPREELFKPDRLHLNADGYKLWASLIKPRLKAVIGEAR